MAIYIKGVEMPKDDDCTILTVYSDGVVYLRQYKDGLCLEDSTNATDIPEPHGRLICADEVGWAKHIPDVGYLSQYQKGWNGGVDYMLGEIDDAPTVIEGSE